MSQPTKPTEADPYPDGLPEDLYIDIESTIHQHCGHDGQSDEFNDWVTDLMAALSPLIVRALVGRPAAPTREHAPDCLHDEPGVTICTCRPVPTHDQLHAKVSSVIGRLESEVARYEDGSEAARLAWLDACDELTDAVVALLSRPVDGPVFVATCNRWTRLDEDTERSLSSTSAGMRCHRPACLNRWAAPTGNPTEDDQS